MSDLGTDSERGKRRSGKTSDLSALKTNTLKETKERHKDMSKPLSQDAHTLEGLS